jgi:hypothetical protein
MSPLDPRPESAPGEPAAQAGASALTQAGAPSAAAHVPAAPAARDPKLWRKKLAAVVFATLCLEIGLYLAIFPWTKLTADFAAYHVHWPNYLDSWYSRAAVSALGLVNLYIAAIEIARLRRFAGK